MNYNDFLDYVKDNLADCYKEIMISEDMDKINVDTAEGAGLTEEERLKLKREAEEKYDNCDIIIQKVVKNNGIILDAVSIYLEGEQVSPNIYLRPYYENYLMGKPLDFILAEIIFQYRNEKNESDICPVDFSDYTNIKDNLVIRVVNYELNKDMLKDCPHIKYLDLAVTFRYVIDENVYGLATIMITYKEYNNWETDIEEVFQTALFNTMHRYPWCMEPLSKLVFDTFDEKMMKKLSEDIVEELNNIRNCELGVNIYILTNQSKAFGAGCLLYDNVIKNFAKVQGCNIYILPSSVHEVMLVPEDDETDPEFLKNLLSDANKSSVGLIDLLSDNIYYYDRNTDNITIFNE